MISYTGGAYTESEERESVELCTNCGSDHPSNYVGSEFLCDACAKRANDIKERVE